MKFTTVAKIRSPEDALSLQKTTLLNDNMENTSNTSTFIFPTVNYLVCVLTSAFPAVNCKNKLIEI